MASAKQDILSLLTEHFEYTPLTLIDDIINTVNELVYRAVTAVETGLNNTPSTGLGFHKARAAASDSHPDTSVLSQSEVDENGDSLFPEKRTEVENGVHKLETLLEASVDKNFDKFEIYVLRNILSIRDGLERWVELEHYRNLDFSHTVSISNTPPTAEAVLQLRQKLTATRRLNASLSAEQGRNAVVLSQLRAMLSPRQPPSVSDFKSSGAPAAPNDNGGPTTNLSFFTQSQALQNLRTQVSAARNEKTSSKATRTVQALDAISIEARSLIAQLPRLRALLAELREVQSRGFSAPSTIPGGRPEQERRAYLEGAVRSGLGDVTGLPDKATVAAAAATGSATARGDFGAIEGIATTLARDPGQQRDNRNKYEDMAG